MNVVYAPNSEADPKSGSGFSTNEVSEIETGIKKELSAQTFHDYQNLDSDGNPYEVKFQINFVQVPTLEEAYQKYEQESDRTTVLETGGYKIKYTDVGVEITLATTSLGHLKLNSSIDSHTNTHELFHSLVHFAKNAPTFFGSGYNQENQGPWHEKFGGIFSYKETLPLNQQNVTDATTSTPTILIIPNMGPYTEEQQQFIDSGTLPK